MQCISTILLYSDGGEYEPICIPFVIHGDKKSGIHEILIVTNWKFIARSQSNE